MRISTSLEQQTESYIQMTEIYEKIYDNNNGDCKPLPLPDFFTSFGLVFHTPREEAQKETCVSHGPRVLSFGLILLLLLYSPNWLCSSLQPIPSGSSQSQSTLLVVCQIVNYTVYNYLIYLSRSIFNICTGHCSIKETKPYSKSRPLLMRGYVYP